MIRGGSWQVAVIGTHGVLVCVPPFDANFTSLIIYCWFGLVGTKYFEVGYKWLYYVLIGRDVR
jgi:hypothetical protein